MRQNLVLNAHPKLLIKKIKFRLVFNLKQLVAHTQVIQPQLFDSKK